MGEHTVHEAREEETNDRKKERRPWLSGWNKKWYEEGRGVQKSKGNDVSKPPSLVFVISPCLFYNSNNQKSRKGEK